MEDKLIQLCDPAKFEYLINDAPNNTLSSAQIQNAVCSEKITVFTHSFLTHAA